MRAMLLTSPQASIVIDSPGSDPTLTNHEQNSKRQAWFVAELIFYAPTFGSGSSIAFCAARPFSTF